MTFIKPMRRLVQRVLSEFVNPFRFNSCVERTSDWNVHTLLLRTAWWGSEGSYSTLLRKTFGPKSEKVTRKWRKQHNEELRDIVREFKLTWVRQTGHVPRFGKDQKQIQDFARKI